MQSSLEEAQAEASKEHKLRERAEMFSKELSQELEAMKQRSLGRSASSTNLEQAAEITRLKTELERRELQYEEQQAELQRSHHADIDTLTLQLQEAEAAKQLLQDELSALEQRINSLQGELQQEHQESMESMRLKYEQDKKKLHDQVLQWI